MYNPEIDSYVDQFLTYLKLEKGFSSHSISSYRTDLIQFINVIKLPVLDMELSSRVNTLAAKEKLKQIHTHHHPRGCLKTKI